MAWRVFYSYAHEDRELRDKLSAFLAPLVQNNKLVEWYDRKVKPGADWAHEINDRLDTADLILLLVSGDFLASEYCFGVEVDKALARLKQGEAEVVPILLKPCLFDESRFSELQFLPRDAKPITSSAAPDDAFVEVAKEIRDLVSGPPPAPPQPASEADKAGQFDSSLDLVRNQVRAYANLYERIRQRMRPSHDRTERMEEIFQKMRALATASYPLLDELAGSTSPGERLAAVAILQVFASEPCLDLLVKLVGSEKPFVGYHATKALHFAVGAVDPRLHPRLLKAILEARAALDRAQAGFDTDRQAVLRQAEQQLRATTDSLAT